MNWLSNLCSCSLPALPLKKSIIDYLNSSTLNRQVIQQEKCTQRQSQGDVEAEGQGSDPCDHVYRLAKQKSYKFVKLEENSDGEDDQKMGTNRGRDQQQADKDKEKEDDEIIDTFWYPKNIVGTKDEHYSNILKHKTKILQILLSQQPSSGNYDKVYDSQDETNLLIYCRLESLVKGKKINSYRFSFTIQNITFKQFQQWQKQSKQRQLFPLLQSITEIVQNPQNKNINIFHKIYKKLLVINPHQFYIAQKTWKAQEKENERKQFFTVAFSVKEQELINDKQKEKEKEKLKQKQNQNGKGWLHLFGIHVQEKEKYLLFKGFISLELEVSISPSMLKQPISKQIRICVQKLISNIRKSDQI